MKPASSRLAKVRPLSVVVATLALLCLAPTPGDIGGCGQPAEDLDVPRFLGVLAATDCRRCVECGLHSATCELACSDAPVPSSFPEGCAPLAHDGEVCLRRLQQESCSAFARYVVDDDEGKAVPLLSRPRPSECQFCPLP